MSRVLFIVLIGCALAFGSPVKVRTEQSNKVSGVPQQDVEEATALSKRIQVIEGVLRALYDVVEVESNPEQIKNVVRNLNVVLKKAFNEDLDLHFEVINEKDVQRAMKIMVKRACEAFKEYLASFFERVKNQFNDQELEKLIEELIEVLENIFNYQETENKRRIQLVEDEDESVQKLTPEEFENISNGFKENFANIVEEILNQLIEQLSAVEGQVNNPELEQFIEELKHILESITSHKGREKKRSLSLVEDESVQKITSEESENISNGFKDTFVKIVEAILEQLVGQLSEEEKQELIEAIEGMQGLMDQ